MASINKLAVAILCISVSFSSCRPFQIIRFNGIGEKVEGSSDETVFPTDSAGQYRNAIPVKVVRSFIQEFGDARHVAWQKTGRGLSVASFSTDSMETRIDFNSDGGWNHIWKNYQLVPGDIKKMVAGNFPEYNIHHVTALVFPNDRYNTIFSVQINEGSNIKVLKVYKGRMEVVNSFTDSSTDAN